MKSARTLLFAVLIVGLCAAALVISRRHRAELAYNTVEIAVDMDEVRSLADSQPHTTLSQILGSLKAAGVTSVAITENQLEDYLSSGMAHILPVGSPSSPHYEIDAESPQIQSFITSAFVQQGLGVATADGRVVTNLPPAELTHIPLRFIPQAPVIRWVQDKAGMAVIARAQNFPEITEQSLLFLGSQLHDLNVQKVIFAGDEVGGWRGALNESADLFRKTGLTFGSIEFGKQKGSQKLEALLKGKYVRVHSISSVEMAKYQPVEAVERFVRAARDRGDRLLYVHLLTTNGTDAVQQNIAYIKEIMAGLHRSELRTGISGIVGNPHPSRLELILIGFGVAAGVTLLAGEFFTLALPAALEILIPIALVLTAAAFAGDMGRKVIALTSALAFPTWAAARCARLCSPPGGETGKAAPSSGNRGLELVSHYLAAIVAALFGGVLIAAALSGRLFMTETEEFAGVKAAHLVPILTILFASAGSVLGRPLPWKAFWSEVAAAFRKMWNSPVLFRYAIVGLVGMTAVLIVVIRSGNETAVGVSQMEIKFRAFLDQILYVRPRTKEIFVGYPSLWAAIWLSQRSQVKWSRVFFTGATLGLVSAVNTCCHIHTPVTVSFLRIINGIWVGALGGIVLVWVLKAFGLGVRPSEA